MRLKMADRPAVVLKRLKWTGSEGDDIAKWGILVNWEARKNRMISTERGCFRKGATQSL
jgi:hypothetical protein